MGSKVADYYIDQSLFITGATGFLGKVLVEKLLRSCPGLEFIFLLIRVKRGQNAEERLESFFDAKLFDTIKLQMPERLEKVKAISGDMAAEQLGISDQDMARLVNCRALTVIHSAATIRFDEALRLALQLNVGGMRKVVQLCHKLPNLQALVHISTAYANCDHDYIEEKVYPSPTNPSKLLDALDWLTDEAAGKLTPVLLGKKPNTYTYTKHLAELLLVDEGRGLPYIIVRPSIIGASWEDPFPGWIDNMNGPTGLFLAIGTGMLRTVYANPEATADIVPVDLVVNAVISAPWYRSQVQSVKPIIIHSCSGSTNPVSWGKMNELIPNFYRSRTPFHCAVRYPSCRLTDSRLKNYFYIVMCHRFPAFMVDMFMKSIGKTPRMLKMYEKIHKAMDTVAFFTENHWEWENTSLQHLQESLVGSDAETFNTSVEGLTWIDYLENFFLGIKLFLLNEEVSEMPKAHKRMHKLKTVHYLFNTFSAVVLWRLLMLRSEIACKLWNMFFGFFLRWLKYLNLHRFITL